MTMTLLPSETVAQALLRRIKMHEFLMSGGVQVGYDEQGRMVYGPPITVATDPVCPWHGEDCEAWSEIVAGRGYWTKMEASLVSAKRLLKEVKKVEDDPQIVETVQFEVDRLRDALALRPRDSLALRQRTPEQIEAEHAEATRKFKTAVRASQEAAHEAIWGRKDTVVDMRTGEVLEDSREDIAAALIGEVMPDEIVIEGDEEDE